MWLTNEVAWGHVTGHVNMPLQSFIINLVCLLYKLTILYFYNS